ncbi:DUF5615 family PIN-like protein [Thermosynechococcaceae cyanobacterium BACA0444]|uniref:DUF5615 family PIN-like protein n=2 Tax=Pseudocalidococcus TaxID=3110321 RepID=A0AAE4JVH3_9CYAN|nr:DUF5615 family PIN-like protein [Pseudocalidococcus azoricus BACA0444]
MQFLTSSSISKSVKIKFLADENLDNKILKGLLQKHKSIDIVRVQDVGLSGKSDPTVLAWAAEEKRILLTHDVKTIIKHASERIHQALPMPGVILIKSPPFLSQVIEDILVIWECTDPIDFDNRIEFLPLK